MGGGRWCGSKFVAGGGRWAPTTWLLYSLQKPSAHSQVTCGLNYSGSGMEVYGLYGAAHVSPDSHTKNRPPRFFPPHEPRDAKIVPRAARNLYEKSR